MPSSRVVPRYGQIWSYASTTAALPIVMQLMLIAPAPRKGAWHCLVLRKDGKVYESDWIQMSGLYSDRNPIPGYTLEAT